ncbi:conserved exported protein of unknown function [Candidatus Filomicrobium marinum]|uniref:Uncharacterized protein n=1 Tax=Candidatus Filomicrobium marinum TaxID=1608628 RepID=A0A0D6JAP9_9HYPH|nr:hypothetical protein [Candidatus Filomicrobium marinum]CFX03032.1 conserved exported protein of unknown function [Candidatus Filomicrobium marinum]CPR15768.1 conserved exported protein of unknown function [Candidatus Filomicrobium marinum]
MLRTRIFRPLALIFSPVLICGTQLSPATADPASKNILTKEEAAYGCRKINGRMQLLILQIRDYPDRAQGSQIARGIQGITVPLFGGTQRGLDPDAQYQRDVRKLEAFNARLAKLKCPTFDLQAELSARDVKHTPKPQQPKAK